VSRVGIGVVLLIDVGALLNPPVTTQAEPNPYGRRSSQTTIVLQPDGSYDVRLVQAQTLDIAYQPGDPVTIKADAAHPDDLELGCVSYASDSEPCGERQGSTLTYAVPASRTEVPPEFVITVGSRFGQVVEPTIDRG